MGRITLLRRARCLVASWEAGKFLLEHYLTGRQVAISPLVAVVLTAADDYVSHEELRDRLAVIPCVDGVIRELRRQDVLITLGSALDRREQRIEQHWRWPMAARLFHFTTRRTRFSKDLAAEGRALGKRARKTPPPSPFKEYECPIVALPGDFGVPRGDFWEVLRNRRTRRAFSRRPISLMDLSTLLLWTWGCTRIMEDPAIGPYILKTSPSGGARQPMEVYPVVLRVTGVEPGIYHYSVRNHALALLQPGRLEREVVGWCGNQPWVRDAAVVFFMTAVVARSMWKYPQAHAYRVLLLDAGHLGQTFHLVCTRLGLAPFTTAATHDPAIEQALGIDGIKEVPVYAAAAGTPREPDAQSSASLGRSRRPPVGGQARLKGRKRRR